MFATKMNEWGIEAGDGGDRKGGYAKRDKVAMKRGKNYEVLNVMTKS